jgi:hypothetical protein
MKIEVGTFPGNGFTVAVFLPSTVPASTILHFPKITNWEEEFVVVSKADMDWLSSKLGYMGENELSETVHNFVTKATES